jgi:phage tail-like protein
MNIMDFDYLFIHTQQGWREGESQSVVIDEKGHLILASKETLSLTDVKIRENNHSETATEIEWQHMAFDGRNHLYLLTKNTGQLYRYSKEFKGLEKLDLIVECNLDESKAGGLSKNHKPQFEQIAISKSTLYLLDIEGSEIHAYFFPSFQSRYRLGKADKDTCNALAKQPNQLEKPIAIKTDYFGNLFVLDVGKRCIFKINPNGNIVQKIKFHENGCAIPLQQPSNFALGPVPAGYLLVLDAASSTIFKFDLENNTWATLFSTLSIDPLLKPQAIAVDKCGIISIAGNNKHIYQFDADGRYIGKLAIEDECLQLTSNHDGELYGLCAKKKQIFHFGGKAEFATAGSYISKVLDSKQFQCHWHRLALEIQVPEKTRVMVHYAAADSPIKAEQMMPDQWESFAGNSNHAIKDALFAKAVGQYLILKFELFGDGFHSPSINRVRVYFQRDSYLRYLPATYQEDAIGRDFLERFLSLFESMSLEIDEKISTVTQYFDADVQGKEFLDWMSSWLAIITDENWPESKQRRLLKESFELYKYRGTQKTLRRVIEIFTESKVVIIEHWRLHPPMILNQMAIIGVNSFVGPKRTQRLIVEETSRIGEFTLDEQEDSPEVPFAKDAYDFTVIADTSKLTNASHQKTLRRLIEAEKPAHTRYFLRTTGSAEAMLGKHSLLGIDTVLGKGPQPMRIGKNARIGKETLVGNHYRIKGRLDTKARTDIDAILF